MIIPKMGRSADPIADLEILLAHKRVRDAYARAVRHHPQMATSTDATHRFPEQSLKIGKEGENGMRPTTLKIHILWQEKSAEVHIGQYMLLIKGMRGVLFRRLPSRVLIRVRSEECRGTCQSHRSFLHETLAARALRTGHMLLEELRYLRHEAVQASGAVPAMQSPRKCPDPSALAPCDAEFCLRRLKQNHFRLPLPRNSGAAPISHGQYGEPQ